MAEKISVQIALEGGQEVARQLEDIGAAGQKAFADIAKSAEQVGGFKKLDPEQVAGKLKELGLEGTAAFDKIQQAVKSAARFESLVQGVQSVETALVAMGRAAGPMGLAIAAAFQAAAKATIAFAETINKASDQAVQLGLTFEQFKQAREDLEKLGISGEGAAEALASFQKQLGEPRTDVVDVLTATGNALRFVGETSNSAAKDLPKFIEQLRQMPDGAARTNLALSRMSKTAATEAVQGLRRAEGSMSDAEAKAYDLQQAIKQLSTAWEQFGSVQLAPTLTAGINVVTAAIRALGAAIEQSPWGTFLQAASLALNPIAGLVQQATKALAQFGASLTGGISFLQVALLALNPILGVVQQATKAIAEFGGALTGITWGTFLQAASLALNPIVGLVQQAIRAIAQFGGALAVITWDTISSGATAAWNAVTSAVQSAGQAISTFVSSLTGITWDTISSGGQAAWQAVISAVQSAGEAISTFVSSLAGITWDTISSGATAAWNAVTSAVQSAGQAISTFVSSLTGITWDTISSAGVAAWNAITDAIQSAINKVSDFISTMLQAIGLQSKAGSGGGGGAPGKAHGGLIGGRGTGTSDSNLAWLSRGEHVMPARVVRQPGVLGFLESLRRGGNLPGFAGGGLIPAYQGGGSVAGQLGGFIQAMGGAIGKVKQIWDGLIDGMQGAYQTFGQASETIARGIQQSDQVVRRTVGSLQQLQIELAKILGELLTSQGKARGGLLGGRGTGTSDSNLAWVSRGEYITPARAVRQPGVLAFLEALRRSGGNLRGVLDGLGRFALGGLVPRPAFAAGGAAGSMSHVTINFPGTPPISGLRASSEVVDQLQRAAALAQVRSGGRKPSRYT